jgi:hypothetical protein
MCQAAGLRRGARTDMIGAGFQRGKPAPPAVDSNEPAGGLRCA